MSDMAMSNMSGSISRGLLGLTFGSVFYLTLWVRLSRSQAPKFVCATNLRLAMAH